MKVANLADPAIAGLVKKELMRLAKKFDSSTN